MPTLDWLNRAAAFKIAKDVPYRLLELVSAHRAASAHDISAQPTDVKQAPQGALDFDAATTPQTPAGTHDNLLIQGDNLEGLKALLPFYRGQVKCIVIDPPYNTKSAFEHYDDNLEHAQWLSMMLPRLQLLRELLREDGSIWVTIDDNEGHYLKVLMDEVFLRENFVANVVWQKKYAVKNDSEFFSESHDHILVYAKNIKGLDLNREHRTLEQEGRYSNPDNDTRGVWTSGPLQRNEFREYAYFPVLTPSGKEYYPPKGTSWRYTQERMAELIADNRISFGHSGSNVPRLKRFLSEVADTVAPTTWWDYRDSGHNDEARRESKLLTDTGELFGTPKPERIVQKIIHFATYPNDLVLDCVLGSGTTAAVAQKMGRRWIGIEMGEHANTHCLPRLQKVIDGEQGGISKAVSWRGGGSFRFMKLGAPIFDETGAIHSGVRFATLAAFVWMQETRTPWHKKKGLSPLLGTHDGVAVYLLFNGILGDRRPQGGNVLTRAVLDWLNEKFPHVGPRVIYGESVRVGPERLATEAVQFRSIPHDVEAR